MSGSKSRQGKRARRKGHNFERAISRIFRIWWHSTRRGIQSRAGGDEAGDVEGTPPFHIECKNRDRWAIPAWWNKLKGECKDEGKVPLLVVKLSRAHATESLVVMNLEDLLAIITSPVDLTENVIFRDTGWLRKKYDGVYHAQQERERDALLLGPVD
ncbi:MAG: hypothetical protein GY937_20130 [bacterium]|nr:hypothetical protein [bacterium]